MKMEHITPAYGLLRELRDLEYASEVFEKGDDRRDAGSAEFTFGRLTLAMIGGKVEYADPELRKLHDELEQSAITMVRRYYAEQIRITKDELRKLGVTQ